MSDALIAAHGEVDKLMPYLHLPVQSGSDRILKAMNRSHTADSYLRTIEQVRAARPDIAISGDFIVGFPGETEEDFEATLRIVDAVRYAAAYSFKYIAAAGHPGGNHGGSDRARGDGRAAAAAARRASPSTSWPSTARPSAATPQVLIERKGQRAGQMIGTLALAAVGPCRNRRARPATMIDVTLTAAGPNSMAGAVRQQAAA